MKINELFPDVLTETGSVEFKARLNQDNPIKWAKAFVALSNAEGGLLFVGVNDQREAFGLTLDEINETKNLIAVVNDRHIFPHARYSFSMRSVDAEAEKFVLAVKIFPSDSIVCYREGDFNETVYVKGDGNSTPAKPSEIIALSKRKYGVDESYTETVYEPSGWKSYNRLCREYRKDGQEPSLKELENMQIVDEEGHASTGLLMFKDDYDGGDTLIHCHIFLGLSKADPVLDRAEYKGSIPETLENALAFMQRNTKHGYYKDGYKRINTHSYPEIARREALVNAIAHRDYSIRGSQIDVNIYDDRLEITSPGSWMLPRDFSEYKLSEIPSIRRNQIICACLDLADLMERGGTGFQTIFESYENEPGGKRPFVESYPGFFVITLPDLYYGVRGPGQGEEATPLSAGEIVLDALSKGPATTQKLQALTPYKSRSRFVAKVINPLLEEGRIERIGNPKSKNSYFVLKKAMKPGESFDGE